MAMKGRTQCVVPGCTNLLNGAGNLCGIHRVPGAIVRLGESAMIITTWYVEYGDECGLIALNDFALGQTFAGAEGFLAKLQSQGFVNVRLLATPEELETAQQRKLASWSGPWQERYPWHPGAKRERHLSDLQELLTTNVYGDDGHALMALVYRDDVKLKFSDGDARTITPQLTVHRVPAGLEDEGTRKWLESLPEIELVEHPERPEGFGGPLPPAGQAG